MTTDHILDVVFRTIRQAENSGCEPRVLRVSGVAAGELFSALEAFTDIQSGTLKKVYGLEVILGHELEGRQVVVEC